jgi:glutathione S-transferase
MDTLPLLYTYRRCPYAMRARMALLQAGVAYEAFEIVLRDKPAAMLAASPKGTVPVLVLSDGRVIEQSWDIVRWAFAQAGDAQGWWR